MVANGEATIIVYFRPIERNEKAAKMLPIQAPAGGIELAHDAIFLVGKISGLFSRIDGTAGAEYPRIRPM